MFVTLDVKTLQITQMKNHSFAFMISVKYYIIYSNITRTTIPNHVYKVFFISIYFILLIKISVAKLQL